MSAEAPLEVFYRIGPNARSTSVACLRDGEPAAVPAKVLKRNWWPKLWRFDFLLPVTLDQKPR